MAKTRPPLTATVFRGLVAMRQNHCLVAYLNGEHRTIDPSVTGQDIEDAKAACRWLDKTQIWRESKGFKM